MHNMNSIIFAHNRSIFNPPKTNYGWNCRDNTNCPSQNQCLTPNIVYQADVSNNLDNEKRVYLGVSETPLKGRYCNHIRNSKHERYSNATELSKNVWELKRNNKVPIITCKIARKVRNHKHNFCRLSLIEKLLITKFPNQDILINKRSEFISKCTHENKLRIVNMK